MADTQVGPSRATDSRFDASDLMPVEVGAGTFWDGMLDWFHDGPNALDDIMADIEAEWPDGESMG